jgi:hypothetical protein
MTNQPAKLAAGMSTAAAIAAALAWINSRKASAAPPAGELTLPEEFVQLIVAIAADTATLDDNVLKILDEMAKLAIGGAGYPHNVKTVRAFTKACLVADVAYQGDDMEVPDGMQLAIKSYPTNPVGSLVRVASTQADAINPNSSWPLVFNEAITYQVQNAKEMYVSATIAGCIVVFSCEKVP